MQGMPEPASARPPSGLVTIDVEGDDLWSHPPPGTTRNAAHLPRFQALCERTGLRPTYLVDYEMATDAALREFAADVIARDAGEIGMHLHAWSTPPRVPLTADDVRAQPYLADYRVGPIRDKVSALTDLLEDTFGRKMRSHRGGRWSLNETIARILVEHGYEVDCTVTPHVSWRGVPGDPSGPGGPDFTRFPDHAYFVDLDDVQRSGSSPLLEIPVTVVPARFPWQSPQWLRPRGGDLRALLAVVARARREGRGHVEFMLHSSELMPGGSPRFPTEHAIESLYRDLEALFATVVRDYPGATLSEHRAKLAGPADPSVDAAEVPRRRDALGPAGPSRRGRH